MANWQNIWKDVCEMAYEKATPIEKIIIEPNEFQYTEENTLTYMWKKYSKKHGPIMPGIVYEFKELYVPKVLFEDLGIQTWFRYSFPNCKVSYWQTDQFP